MPRNLKTQAQLQAEITKLKQEITQLRTLLKVIWDTAGQAGHLCEDCAAKEEKHE
jgi:hypothetical protein